jgi:sigma-B regulation protein RsbU (phosphoserine phosphatase)
VISRISRITVGAEEIAKNVSFQVLYFYKHNDLDLFLNQVLKANPIIESVHFEFLSEGSKKFSACNSPSKCPHRCNLNEGIFPEQTDDFGKGVWSRPFYCMNDTSHLLVSYRMPVYFPDSKQLAGQVYCEISVRKMKEMLDSMKIAHNGYVYIIDRDGNFITHPSDEWAYSRNFFANPSFVISKNKSQIVTEIKSGQSGASYARSEYLNNKPVWFYFAPLLDTNWSIIIVMPESELFRELDLIFWKIIWVCSLGILILFLLNMLIFRRILTPLANIIEAIQRFSSQPGKGQKSKDEIQMLTDSLEDWQAKYGSLIKERSQTESDKLKYEKDLKSAREIQQNIIPVGKAVFTEHPEIDLFAILKPAEKVGGDLYDYFFIDKNHLLIAIGDVSGKGIPASLFMAIASTLIKTNAKILSAKEIVGKVNRELSNRNTNQYFLTLFVGILDVRTGVLDYCNAAHNYPYILRSDGELHTLSKSHGLPLGIYKDKTYKSSTVELKKNDTMILYTDGVINAVDDKKQHYGTDRLEKNIQNLNELTSEEVVDRLLKSIVIYEGNRHQADDISLLALKYLKNTESQV